MARIPAEAAFEYYAKLGPKRSYRAVADRFGVSKQSVTKLAQRNDWQGELEKVEKEAQDSAVQRARESLDAMNERHLQMLRVVQRKALEALQAMPLTTAMEAARALDMSIAKERLVRGEPSDRTAVDVESTLRSEVERWMVVSPRDKDD